MRSKYSRKRLALVALIVGSCLRVQENSDRANRPMLLVVPGDDCDALYLLLVIFHESSMIFKGRDILPAVEPGSINRRIDLRRNLAKVVSLHFAGAMILNTLPEIMSVLIMRNLLQSKPDAAAVSCALASVPPSIPQRSVGEIQCRRTAILCRTCSPQQADICLHACAMRIWPISTRVNKPENDDPSIVEPIALANSAA